jgi:ferrous iron transport protein A
MLNPFIFNNDGGCLSSFIISIFTVYFYNPMFTPFTIMGCSLELMKAGDCGIVTVCQSQDEIIRKKLILMGIKTGDTITVEQQFPTFVIKCGSLSMTIDREIARAIYVRVIDG